MQSIVRKATASFLSLYAVAFHAAASAVVGCLCTTSLLQVATAGRGGDKETEKNKRSCCDGAAFQAPSERHSPFFCQRELQQAVLQTQQRLGDAVTAVGQRARHVCLPSIYHRATLPWARLVEGYCMLSDSCQILPSSGASRRGEIPPSSQLSHLFVSLPLVLCRSSDRSQPSKQHPPSPITPSF